MDKICCFRFRVLAKMASIEKVWFRQNDWISIGGDVSLDHKSPFIKALKARHISAEIIALKAQFISAMGVAHGADNLFCFWVLAKRASIEKISVRQNDWISISGDVFLFQIPVNQSAEGEAYISWNHSAEGVIYISHKCSPWLIEVVSVSGFWPK